MHSCTCSIQIPLRPLIFKLRESCFWEAQIVFSPRPKAAFDFFLFFLNFFFRIVEQESLHAINVTGGLIHGARRSAVAQQYGGFRVGPRGITADGKMRSEQQRGRHVEPRRWPLKRALIMGINLQVCDWTLIIRGPIAPNANCILIGALNDAFFPLISPPRQRINGILSSWYQSNSRSVSGPSNWFKGQTCF